MPAGWGASRIVLALAVALAAAAPAASAGRTSRTWKIVYLRGERTFIVNADGSDKHATGFPGFPTYAPDGQRLVFAVDETRNFIGRLYVANADGTDRRPVSPRDELCFDPDWSPDGSRVVFSAGCDVDFRDIFVADRAGTRVTRLSARRYLPWEITPVWAPDGQTILYAAYTTRHAWRLWLMNRDGRHRRLVKGHYPGFPSDADYAAQWSPDGKRIFARRQKGLFVMKADGSAVRDLTPSGYAVDAFDLSPDGRRIVFDAAPFSPERDIWVMNPDGTNVKRLTDAPGSDRGPKWSPDGRAIAFTSERRGNSDIYVMKADGSGQRDVTGDRTGDTSPSWVPVG